jgi:TolB-like protein/DNA-binding winged helix-turn-helix (wHTH) protein/Tfp pilus assembly protein PilF
MPEGKHFYEFGAFQLDPAERLLLREGKPLPLSPKAFETLLLLVENSGHLLRKDEIMQRVWPDAFVEEVNLAHHISAIRRALDGTGGGEQYIETVPKVGYRFMAETRKVSSEAPAVLTTAQAGQPAPTASAPRKQPANRVALLTAAAVLALGVVLLFVWRSRLTRASGTATVSPAQIRSIAVLPLMNLSSDTQQEYFSDGMTDELITDLAKFSKLRVISHTSVQRYKERKRPLPEIARELGADAVVEGTVLRFGDRVRITAQLIDARSDAHLWADSYERDLRDILTLQNEVSQDIASKVGVRLTTAEAARLNNARDLDPAAHEAYLKGNFFWSRSDCEGSKKALEYFQQAAIDSKFAPVYLGLAESYFTLGDWGCWPQDKAFPKAKEAAVKAIELDPNLGSAHTWLANLASFYEWDWPNAEREYKLAIGLDPNYAVAHVFYAVFLADMGKQQESFAEMKRAQELDPTSELTNMVGVHVFYLARQYDQAIKQAKTAIELNPNSWGTFIWLGASYERKGMYPEASQAYLKSKALEGAKPGELNEFQSAYEHSGIRGFWEKELARVKRDGSVCSLARVSAHLGEPKSTLDYLNQDVQLHCADLRVLNVDPIYDSLRKDRKFQDILRRMKFPG